jgi:hypothetical protein
MIFPEHTLQLSRNHHLVHVLHLRHTGSSFAKRTATSHDLRKAVKNSRSDNSLKLSKAKSGNSWKSESVSLTIMKYSVAATGLTQVFYSRGRNCSHGSRHDNKQSQ